MNKISKQNGFTQLSFGTSVFLSPPNCPDRLGTQTSSYSLMRTEASSHGNMRSFVVQKTMVFAFEKTTEGKALNE